LGWPVQKNEVSGSGVDVQNSSRRHKRGRATFEESEIMNDAVNPNRRDFLKTAALAGAAVGVTSLLGTRASAGSNKGKIKKAVSIGMIGEKGTLDEKFKLVKELGFDGIEFNSPVGNKEEVKKALDANGLGVSEIIDGLHWKELLSSPSEDMRGRGVAALKQALEDAKFFGTNEVLLVPGKVLPNANFDECYKRSQEEIKKVIPYAKEMGVKIGIENVWNDFINDPETMVKYIDSFESEYVMAHYDVGNHVKFNKPEHWVRTLGKRILRLHIKEYTTAKTAEGKVIGFGAKLGDGGDIKWDEVTKALAEIGYTGWATAEVPGGNRDVLKDIAERMNRILDI
jgi:L-ribulose-5-phosphate 3-epimerase